MLTAGLLMFILVALFQILIWGVWFGRLALYQPILYPPRTEQLPVSVIIAAHNEYANLSLFLEKILKQKYPCFEVIIANDRSTDKTSELIADWQKQVNHLREIRINETPQGFQPKKYALTQAIKHAQYPILLLTDADCQPASPNWIWHITQRFEKQTEIVLGFSPYQVQAGWLNKLIQFETLYTAIQYFAFALWGLPYMGVGRNVAYRKQLFERNHGFEPHKHLVGGDDDLFINRWANAKNTRICLSPESFVYSVPKTTWQAWLRQKKRHLSVGKYYKPLHLWLLALIQIAYLLFWLLWGSIFFSLLIFRFTDSFPEKALLLHVSFVVFLFRNVIFFISCLRIARLLATPLRWIELISLEVVFIFVWLYIAIRANTSKKINWE